MLNPRSWRAWLARAAVVASALALPHAAMAAFSLTTRLDSGSASKVQYEVDTNAGLVLRVMAYDNGASTQSAGDISSLVYNGVQYQDPARGSQLNSGFDGLYSNVSAVSVSAEMLSSSGASTNTSMLSRSIPKIPILRHSFMPPSRMLCSTPCMAAGGKTVACRDCWNCCASPTPIPAFWPPPSRCTSSARKTSTRRPDCRS